MLASRGGDILERAHTTGSLILDGLQDIRRLKPRHIESLTRRLEDPTALVNLDWSRRLPELGCEGSPSAGLVGILEEEIITGQNVSGFCAILLEPLAPVDLDPSRSELSNFIETPPTRLRPLPVEIHDRAILIGVVRSFSFKDFRAPIALDEAYSIKEPIANRQHIFEAAHVVRLLFRLEPMLWQFRSMRRPWTDRIV
jgi:hypothetical protein